MADIDFQFFFSNQADGVFEPSKAVYRPGESIAGTLRVSPKKDYKCEKLSIELKWRTTGVGNVSEEVTEEDVVGRNISWTAGTVETYPFELTAPDGPVSYKGTLFSVEWVVVAKADVTWAIDSKLESAPLRLLPAPTTTVAADNYRGAAREVATAHDQGVTGPSGFVGVLAMLPRNAKIWVGLVALAFVGYSVWHRQWFMLAFLLLMCAFGLRAVIRNVAATTKLGKINATVRPNAALPGQAVELELQFEGKPSVSWDELTVELIGEERAVRGSGSSAKIHRHEVHRQVVAKTGTQTIRDGKFNQRVQLPPEAPPTFGAKSNSLTWKISVHIDIPKWPDFRDTIEVKLLPK